MYEELEKNVYIWTSTYSVRLQINLSTIDLVTVFDAILMSRQMCEKLQCLFQNLMLSNFHKTCVFKGMLESLGAKL